ncbi:MAG: amidohydrolase family protein [Planctomycetes bacterium]|nr:amidohydrolase family protein [Planctomycetota bacterium]
MIIDVNAALGYWPFRKLNHNAPDGMCKLMEENGVTRAWVTMLDCIFYKDVQVGNRDLAEGLKGYEKELKPVAVINPGFPGWEDDLTECVEAFGMGAVRLHPNYHNYSLGDDCFARFMDRTAEMNLIVQVAARASDERMHHWHVRVPCTDLTPLGKAAREHRDVKIVLLNVRTPEANKIEGGLAGNENVFVDISHVESVNGVGELAEMIGSRRVLFGSQAPYQYMASAVLKMQEADLDDEAKENIFFKNTQGLEGKP